ncbi:MAG: hypothetical protein KIT80_21585 [Chitinophagaceae bacterium]|nr:hypothetical protein [Chitinophagaceae bacterium]MCW5929527.1 hypothetical protein [Chitinophagaceae bacterium]
MNTFNGRVSRWRQFSMLCIFSVLVVFSSCTKEGLQGPRGPQGPPGENGTGSGGGATAMLSYTFKSNSFQWHATGTDTMLYYGYLLYVTSYVLRHQENNVPVDYISLPASLNEQVEKNGILVLGVLQTPYSREIFPISHIPVEFYSQVTYSYSLKKSGNGYRLSIIAKNMDFLDQYPMGAIQVVAIPPTANGVIHN